MYNKAVFPQQYVSSYVYVQVTVLFRYSFVLCTRLAIVLY